MIWPPHRELQQYNVTTVFIFSVPVVYIIAIYIRDEGNTSGDQNNPFLTIDYAMSMIYPTEDNPVTIHLTAGEFSPTNNNETLAPSSRPFSKKLSDFFLISL